MTLRPKPEQERPLRAGLQIFALEQVHEQLRAEPAYEAGRNAITLRKAPGMQIVLLTQRAGNLLAEHQATGPISLHILSGRVRFTTPDQTVELSAGMLLGLNGGIAHSVEALEDSVSLLTLGQAEDGMMEK
jgi:quercetin dioxygenase-like cupin family protein